MFSLDTLQNISDVAAYRAAEEGRTPLVLWKIEDLHHVPFIGDYTPQGWRRATWADLDNVKPRNGRGLDSSEATFMVDSSGFGSTSEPALTFDEAYQYWDRLVLAIGLDRTPGLAIREAGQFQIVMGVYLKDEQSEGDPAPDEFDVMCDECGTVHNHLEECDPYGPLAEACPACGDPIDYCQGHGEIGDPKGYAILQRHDSGDHSTCNIFNCERKTT